MLEQMTETDFMFLKSSTQLPRRERSPWTPDEVSFQHSCVPCTEIQRNEQGPSATSAPTTAFSFNSIRMRRRDHHHVCLLECKIGDMSLSLSLILTTTSNKQAFFI